MAIDTADDSTRPFRITRGQPGDKGFVFHVIQARDIGHACDRAREIYSDDANSMRVSEVK